MRLAAGIFHSAPSPLDPDTVWCFQCNVIHITVWHVQFGGPPLGGRSALIVPSFTPFPRLTFRCRQLKIYVTTENQQMHRKESKQTCVRWRRGASGREANNELRVAERMTKWTMVSCGSGQWKTVATRSVNIKG